MWQTLLCQRTPCTLVKTNVPSSDLAQPPHVPGSSCLKRYSPAQVRTTIFTFCCLAARNRWESPSTRWLRAPRRLWRAPWSRLCWRRGRKIADCRSSSRWLCRDLARDVEAIRAECPASDRRLSLHTHPPGKLQGLARGFVLRETQVSSRHALLCLRVGQARTTTPLIWLAAGATLHLEP